MKRLTRASAHLAALLALATGAAVASPALAVSPAAPQAPSAGSAAVPLVSRTAYRNPVSRPFADTFADPSVIRGKDGWWYSYGTSDPLRAGEVKHRRIPIARSRDLVSWRYVGDAFTEANLPSWADLVGIPDPDPTKAIGPAAIWAPDVRYVDGQYRMYYVVTQTTITPEGNDSAIGMATAPTPVGPWTDSGRAVVGPRRGPGGGPGDFLWTFDPSVVTNTDGSQWLFYGSYYGGVYVQRLAADGRTLVGLPTMVGIDNKFEGAYAVHRNGYWYLFLSTANCCGGPTTGYSVQVGRSKSITGPYRDREGVSLTASRAGGTPTLTQNGNRWVGAGHNAVATDLSGQDWIVYHAIDQNNPYLVGTEGINRRPMLLDRLDWVGGWPYVRADRGPSNGRQAGPATGGRWVTDFTGGVPRRWRMSAGWRAASERQSGAYRVSGRAGTLVTGAVRLPNARVEADLRSTGRAYGLQARVDSSTVQLLINPERRTVLLQQRRAGRVLASRTVNLPGTFRGSRWHSVSLELRRGRAVATVSHARLGDPIAVASLSLRDNGRVRHAGAVATGAGVAVDNLSVLPAYRPVRRLVRELVPSRLDRAASDEFNGAGVNSGWSWVRRNAGATVGSGGLTWPVEDTDLVGPGGTAGVLLRDVGSGPWTVQTKVSINLGVNDIKNFQQGGLIAYVNDDLFTRLSHVAIWNTRQNEFGHERPYAGRTSYGGTIIGPPARTTWLRITHRVDPGNGEHELRGWSSRNGRTWTKGGVWTLPAGSDIRVGLISHGRQTGERATATFDYFRVYR